MISGSVQVEVDKLTDELVQTRAELERTKAELQLNQGMKGILSEDSSENLVTPTLNNQMMMEEKSTCKDKLSQKKCKRLKKKNNGKGCQNKSTQKKCIKTCKLCPDGKLGVSHHPMNYLHNYPFLSSYNT